MSEKDLEIELIRKVQEGNKQAFNTLVAKYQYKVFRLISRYVTDPSEVFDVAQDTFIKAYQSMQRFRGESGFYTWLYRIAINTAKNHVIAKGRRVPDVDYEIFDMEHYLSRNSSREYSTPEKTLIYQEMKNLLLDIVKDLPGELRTAVMLREIADLTYDEIASTTGCPVGTVRSRIFRARQSIEEKVATILDKSKQGKEEHNLTTRHINSEEEYD